MFSTTTRRPRRRFQPTLEGLDWRIAPTVYGPPAVGPLAPPPLPKPASDLPDEPINGPSLPSSADMCVDAE